MSGGSQGGGGQGGGQTGGQGSWGGGLGDGWDWNKIASGLGNSGVDWNQIASGFFGGQQQNGLGNPFQQQNSSYQNYMARQNAAQYANQTAANQQAQAAGTPAGQQTATNTPWNGMTFQQSMGLYPQGMFPGYTPPAMPANNFPMLSNPMTGYQWNNPIPLSLSGSSALTNQWSFPGAAANTPWYMQQPGQSASSFGGQPFTAPTDYLNFANLAVGTGKPATAADNTPAGFQPNPNVSPALQALQTELAKNPKANPQYATFLGGNFGLGAAGPENGEGASGANDPESDVGSEAGATGGAADAGSGGGGPGGGSAGGPGGADAPD